MTKLKAIERYQDSELKRIILVGEIIEVKNPLRVQLLINAGKCEKVIDEAAALVGDEQPKPKRRKRK
jgi:hypothetical protein